MRIISFFIVIFALGFEGFSQTVEINFDQLKSAFQRRSLEAIDIDTTDYYFSIKKGRKYTFYDVPVSMLNANNDFFLSRKKVRAEYTFAYSEAGFFIYLSDLELVKDFKITVKSLKGENFFVRFYHGKRNYFRIRECENCTFTIIENDRDD